MVQYSLMAECSTCGGKISKSAKVCPHCGQKKPYTQSKKLPRWMTWVIITILVLMVAPMLTVQNTSPSGNSPAPATTTVAIGSERSKEARWVLESQDGVREHLKDPKSAQFRNSFFVRWKDTPVICGEVNSKNSMGGYGGFQRFVAAGHKVVYLEEQVADFDNVWHEICRK